MITKARDPEVWARTKYFPLGRHWQRLGRIFRSEQAEAIWRPCMEDYSFQRAQANGYDHKSIRHQEYPCGYESCDWRWDYKWHPKFWKYACHSACHWVCDLALYAAKTEYPETPWRILSSQKHSTVWNGSTEDPVLFDINFLAMGVPPEQAIKLASRGREYKVGSYMMGFRHKRLVIQP